MKKAIIKALSVMLVVVMTLTSAPLSGFVGLELPEWLDFSISASAATSGTCGENLTWSFDESTGTLTISGTGAMMDYKRTNPAPWGTSVKEVIIEEGVANIGNYAFYECANIFSVTISLNVEYIGKYAFGYCSSLSSIVIPNSVKTICEGAFDNCSSLIDVELGENVQQIDYGAFFRCDNLISISFPESISYIGGDAFGYCTSLSQIIIPKKINLIESRTFRNCSALTTITIPENITTIGSEAFRNCDSLTSINIPSSVTEIGGLAFAYCDNLCNVTISVGVQKLNTEAFANCPSLKSIILPSSLTSTGPSTFAGSGLKYVEIQDGIEKIGFGSFQDCADLQNIVIPNSISEISQQAFLGCDSLITINIPDSVSIIERQAFHNCNSLEIVKLPKEISYISEFTFADCERLKTIFIPKSVKGIALYAFRDCYSLENVYYSGSEEDWMQISWNETSGKSNFTNANIHYNFIVNITNFEISIPEDIVFIDVGEHYLFSVYNEEGVNVTQNVSWSTVTSTGDTGEVEIVSAGDVVGVTEGLTSVNVSYWNDETFEFSGDSCYVYVGEPNELVYESISDQIYYYGENAFYSDACQFSDSVDIYLSLENALNEQIDFLPQYDNYDDELSALDIGQYTIYASVDGTNLSFDKDEYFNNYIGAYSNIPIAKAVDELLTLYPYNLDVSSGDKTFTVSLRIESEDFETIYDSFTFKISSLEDKAINEHISFINENRPYKAMRDADFATGMTDLKNDSQYIWSKYSTFDFENYYEILMADVLVQMMGTQLFGNISLLPALKEWKSNYDKILDNISTIVEDDYTGYMDITENSLDKLFKKSKYVTQPDKINDEVRDTVIDLLGETAITEKINKAFGAIDKTGQVIGFLDFGINIGNDIIDYVNCVSIMNSYKNMNDEFKNVIKKVYDCIPNTDWNVKEAVNHYVNLDTSAGYTEEIIKSAIDLAKNITLETFNSLYKTQFISIFTDAIGSITLKSGALLSSTTAFSTITTGLGAVATGATLGLCISDILCNNSGQAEEMGKVVAASAFAPYIIQTLKYYEWALKEYKDESSLKHFETAFKLNKTLQIYSMEHTYKALEIQANSIIIKLFSNRDYPGAMADLAALKTTHENCNCCEDVSTVVVRTKTIAVKCPVDVYLYDENGTEVVRIINNVTEYVADGITVFINGSEKYITVPANQEYDIKIIATASGTMSYSVIEYDETANRSQIVDIDNISLTNNKVFTGKIYTDFSDNINSYKLASKAIPILPTQQISVPTISIDLSDTDIELDKGETYQLTATVFPENATIETVCWSTNDSSVATVSENGLITAVGGGTAVITASTKDGVIAICEVEVIDFTFTIQEPSRTEIRNKDGIILHANIEGTAPVGSYVVWTSSNDNFDEDVDGNDLTVIAKNKGYTTFTATLYGADGNILATDSVEMYSKSGFFDKIGGFFRSLFGSTKIYED